jgi:hypothetical protein
MSKYNWPAIITWFGMLTIGFFLWRWILSLIF